jgi:hypothetical protein
MFSLNQIRFDIKTLTIQFQTPGPNKLIRSSILKTIFRSFLYRQNSIYKKEIWRNLSPKYSINSINRILV